MTVERIHGYITIGILTLLLAGTGVWYAAAPFVHSTSLSQKNTAEEREIKPLYEGKHVVVRLEDMKLELKNGTTTLETFEILSKGKPGSYYETIGGTYENDYKIREHFSSIGHVYMPWSVHVFGNFFIHGIPFYPDGTEVSSTYSGGCIRLDNEDAQEVFAFIERGTPIVLVKTAPEEFAPHATSTPTIESIEMTRMMAAVVSLEVLSQDTIIRDIDGESTTRRALLPRLLSGDDSVSVTFAKARGEATYLDYMNTKARSLGMGSTRFVSLTEPVLTTREDEVRFKDYIANYKSYLLTLVSAQEQPFQ